MTEQEAVLEQLRTDFPFYTKNCLKIVNKDAERIAFVLNQGQGELDAKLEEQREAGKPRRALVLKARQVGFSTYTQGKLIHQTTLFGNQNAVVVAHDTKTGDKLFKMGQEMYGHLPTHPVLKPPIRAHRRGRFLHFAPPGAEAWQQGDLWPNSTYFVDTAGEFESGRGGTYQLAHLSEFAFWERPVEKYVALMQAVPRRPDSLVIVESTANGMNVFHDMWTDAEEGRSGFIPFFWAWWKEPSYTLPFANEREREDFVNHILGTGAYGEDEQALLEMGLSHEQLHWRRRTIADECAGKLDKFHQEYPSTAEEAFVTSGRQVFDTNQVRAILVTCDITDPRIPDEKHPGPYRGAFEVKETREDIDRAGEPIIVPTKGMWVPREDALRGDLFKLWLPPSAKDPERPGAPPSRYVIGVDVSAGEQLEGHTTSAWHAIQVIDHKTREQIAEYRSHIDANALAKLILLTALHFNNAWIAVEVTGGWGLPVVKRIYLDYRYPYTYIRRAHQQISQDQSKMMGWHTTQATKPLIEANAQEMVREGSHGIKSRDLALEMLSYVKDERGRTGPETGRFSDLLIAWMIAQQVANELPILGESRPPRQTFRPSDPVTGY